MKGTPAKMSTTRKRPMSPLMSQVLKDIAAGRGGYYDCFGRSSYGGRSGTLLALRNRGLIDAENELTDAGRELIAQGRKVAA